MMVEFLQGIFTPSGVIVALPFCSLGGLGSTPLGRISIFRCAPAGSRWRMLGLTQSTSRMRLLHEACLRNVYWLPPVQQCPIVPPEYEKIASTFAWLVLRATDWNALQLAKQ